MQEKQIFLNKNLINELSNNALIVYVALRAIMLKDTENEFISINRLYYILCDVVDFKRPIQEILNKGINELIKNKHIKLIKKINKSDMIVDISTLYVATDSDDYFYSVLYKNEVEKILNLDLPINTVLSLFRYFTNIVGGFNWSDYMNEYKGKICEYAIKKLADDSRISERTAIRYNEILEDEKIIYIHRYDDYIVDDDKNLKSIINGYLRYTDMELCKKYCKEKEYKNGHYAKVEKKELSNYNRSMAIKYSWIVKGKEYPQDEIKDVYEYVSTQNKIINNHLKKYETDNYSIDLEKIKNKIRDLSIFDKFDYIDKSKENKNIEQWGETDRINNLTMEEMIDFDLPIASDF